MKNTTTVTATPATTRTSMLENLVARCNAVLSIVSTVDPVSGWCEPKVKYVPQDLAKHIISADRVRAIIGERPELDRACSNFERCARSLLPTKVVIGVSRAIRAAAEDELAMEMAKQDAANQAQRQADTKRLRVREAALAGVARLKSAGTAGQQLASAIAVPDVGASLEEMHKFIGAVVRAENELPKKQRIVLLDEAAKFGLSIRDPEFVRIEVLEKLIASARQRKADGGLVRTRDGRMVTPATLKREQEVDLTANRDLAELRAAAAAAKANGSVQQPAFLDGQIREDGRCFDAVSGSWVTIPEFQRLVELRDRRAAEKARREGPSQPAATRQSQPAAKA